MARRRDTERPRGAGGAGLVVIITILLALGAWIFPDPLRIGEPKIPRFENSVSPGEDAAAMYLFFEENESKLVYLDIGLSAQEGIHVDRLISSRSSKGATLVIDECYDGQPCFPAEVYIEPEPEVEEHVFEAGEPNMSIRGYFIVSDYITQMSVIEIALKPVSIKDVP